MKKNLKTVMMLATVIMVMSFPAKPVMATEYSWKQDGKGWWVESSDGGYLSNTWFASQGKWYYLGPDGYMLTNTITPDGYQIGADGAWITGIVYDNSSNTPLEEDNTPNKNTITTYLSQLSTFTESGKWNFDGITKDNLGNEHTHSIVPGKQNMEGSVVYKLNKQYDRLTGVYYQKYGRRSSSGTTVLMISGDGRKLWEGTMSSGVEPVNIDIDITNVSELKIEFQATGSDNIALGDVALWQ